VLGNPSGRKSTIVVDGVVAGYVVSWDHGRMRLLGYWVARSFWGRGVATAAVSKFVTQEKARPLHAYVAAENIGSIRVLVKCGFRVVGDLVRGADGVDEYLYRLDAVEQAG
jgi:RimJ/RimL family protein N-acetyltransferase